MAGCMASVLACATANVPDGPAASGAGGATSTSSAGGGNVTSGAGGAVAHCPDEASLCGGACVDVTKNGLHCGECDNACVDTAQCVAGECQEVCGAATACGSAYVDVQVDPSHCGACDMPCPAPANSEPVCVKGESYALGGLYS